MISKKTVHPNKITTCDPVTTPYVTAIMPIRNEARYIEMSLGAVLAQDYPSEYMEVLVVDGLSTDGTRDLVNAKKKHYPNLLLLDNPGLVVAPGLNDAICQARGEILIIVDGHCEIASDYVKNCVYHLQFDDVQCVGGPIETIGETRTGQTIAIAMSSSFGVGNSAFRTVKDKTMLVDTVAFPAYTKSVFEKVGLFDEDLVINQDDEFNFRLRKLGYKILLADNIRSRYYCRNSLSALWTQYYRYGFWKVRLLQKYPRQMGLRQFIPPIFVATLIISAFCAFFATWGWVILILTVGSYVAANLIASLLISYHRGWKSVVLLPVVFIILHVSYGSGFLIGLMELMKTSIMGAVFIQE